MSIIVEVLTALGIGSAVIVAVVVYALKNYSSLKIILSDIYRAFGFLGSWVRKESVSSEVEGTLNGVIDDFNNNFSTPILPNCKIQWVTPENQKNTLIENEAIVCLSFDKKDHDLNFYNATYNFIQTALVAKAKPFIKKSTAKAIDLLSTKIILRQYRREVLRTFNNKFAEVEQETKDTFHRLDETDQNGLFSTLLLPEVFHLGELLNEKTPHPIIENEIEKFLNWFYDLATRDIDERTTLRYESPNIKIGVILVAKLTTYNQYGAAAYTNRAAKYASEHFNAVYLLSKGHNRNKIAREVASILTTSKGFDQMNKIDIIKKPNDDGTTTIITCICLRPDPTTIRFNAWEFLKEKFSKNEKVIGIIETVIADNVIVNVSGLQTNIPNKNLSSAIIPDATKLFYENQELELSIVECDADREFLTLSNVGTKTDPKIWIDSNLSNDKPINAKVSRIQKTKEGEVKGIIAKCTNPDIEVFIPRSKATYSRFTDLEKKFTLYSDVVIAIQDFNFGFGNFIGKIFDLKNPYETISFTSLNLGDDVTIAIKDIQERFVIGEIEEGIECILYADQVAWNQVDCNTQGFKIDDSVKVKIISLDKEHFRISVSQKQFSQSPEKEFYDANRDKIIDGVITNIDNENGIYFKNDKLGIQGFVHWSELVWGSIYPISSNFSVGNPISVKIIAYKKDYNSVQYSCKRCLQHQFTEFNAAFDDKDYVTGVIKSHYLKIATVELNYNGLIVKAYIHKSKISNCCYTVDCDIPIFLPISSKFSFVIERFDEKFSVLELSRKLYLEEINQVNLGEAYKVKYTKTFNGKCYFYTNELEGFVASGKSTFQVGQELEVIPYSTSSNEFELVK